MDSINSIYADAMRDHSPEEIKIAENWIRTKFARFVQKDNGTGRDSVIFARYRFSPLDFVLGKCEEQEIGNPGQNNRIDLTKFALIFIDVIMDPEIKEGSVLEAMIQHDKENGFGYAQYLETFPNWRVEDI